MSTTRYIALLRGINVGGNKMIKMADLRHLVESLGYDDVKTVLASGNVAWDTENDDADVMRTMIEQAIETTFGFSVSVIIIPQAQIETLVESDPFAGIEVTKDTRLYVTFLPEPPTSTLNIPYHAPDKDFSILRVSDTEICSVLTLSGKTRTTDSMNILEAEFGKNITTRNWNTVLKLENL